MLLATDVARCRYCGNTLPDDFWNSAASSSPADQTPLASGGSLAHKRQPELPRQKTAAISTSKATASQGFSPPTIGWPVKILLVVLLAIAAIVFWPNTEAGEKQATDCRSQCFAKEKKLPNPPKHFMSGCMQGCMRP